MLIVKPINNKYKRIQKTHATKLQDEETLDLSIPTSNLCSIHSQPKHISIKENKLDMQEQDPSFLKTDKKEKFGEP